MAECHIYKLPNEVLLSILAPIPSPQLLPLARISQRFYALILRIIQNRLGAAAELKSHSLLLECYHPSAKLTEPPYFCTYLGTNGLSPYENQQECSRNRPGTLGEFRKLYSSFRPYRRELENGGRRVRRPPGDVPGSRTYPGTVTDSYEGDAVKQTLHLDEHEPFTQLCAQCSLAKYTPRSGFPTSFVDVEEGVVRLHKNWLKRMAEQPGGIPKVVDAESAVANNKDREAVWEITTGRKDSCFDEFEKTQWVTARKDVGLRFKVKRKKIRGDMPILVRADEDLPVSYEIEFEELIIRTWHLLLVFEQSLVQDDNSGQAVIFGSLG